MQVNIKNFQSILSCSFSIQGFTVLIGENNIGKSAAFRSVCAALENKTGDDFITQGQPEVQVEIKDDFDLTWTKQRKKGGSYILDGEPFAHAGRNPDILDPLGFAKIKLKNEDLDPHFRFQRERPFLVRESNQVLAEYFSEILRFGNLGNAITQCGKDLKQSKADIKVCEKELDRKQKYLQYFAGLEQVELLDKECHDLNQSYTLDKLTLGLIESTQSYVDYQLNPLPSAKNVSEDLAVFTTLCSYRHLPESPDSVPDVSEGMIDDIHLLQDIENWRTLPEDTLPPLPTSDVLAYLIYRLNTPEDVTLDLAGVDSLLNQTSYLASKWYQQKGEEKLSSIEDEIKLLETEQHQLFTELGACPLCQRGF
jgi:hypothetical protein